MAIRNVCLEGADEKAAVVSGIAAIYFVRAPQTHALLDRTVTIALDLGANPRAHVNEFAAWLRTSL